MSRVDLLTKISILLKDVVEELSDIPQEKVLWWLKYGYFKDYGEKNLSGSMKIFDVLCLYSERSNEERALGTIMSIIFRNTKTEGINCHIESFNDYIAEEEEIDEDIIYEFLEFCDVPLPVDEKIFEGLSTFLHKSNFLKDIAIDYGVEPFFIENIFHDEDKYRKLYYLYLDLYRYIDEKWAAINDSMFDDGDISNCEMSSTYSDYSFE